MQCHCGQTFHDSRMINILLIRDMVVERCYRQFGCETIHPTHKKIFNEFIANALRDNIGMITFDL